MYRLLAGGGYTKSGVTFNGVPAAKAPSTYNQAEAVSQVRVAYGHALTGGHQSWSSWCATCHPNMHSANAYVHPVDRTLGGRVVTTYNSYVRSGALTGTQATAFSSLVPIVTGTVSYVTLAGLADNGSPTYAGPTGADRLTCLSCHRAHASAFPAAVRWQIESEFMTVAGNYMGVDNPAITDPDAAEQNRGRTMAENQAGYYDRPATRFATWQRVLCNKCHAKD